MSPDMEQLLRESLRTAPTPEPSVSDPLSVVGKRVRRARAMWGGGLLAGAAVVAAAIVVPLTAGGSPSGAGRLVPGGSPAPSSATGAGAIAWDRNAVAVTSGGGWLWELQRDPKSNNGAGFVVKVDPRTHAAVWKRDVTAPADYLAYGADRVWVWGGGDGAYPTSKLQIVDPASSTSDVRPGVLNNAAFNGVAFLDGFAWVTTGHMVWQVASNGVVASKTDVKTGAGPIVTAGGSLWVGVPDHQIMQLRITRGPAGSSPLGAQPGLTQGTADAPLRLVGLADDKTLIVSNGNDVHTEPLPSSAEGGPGDNGVDLKGVVTNAVVTADGHIVAAAGTDPALDTVGVYDIPVDGNGALCQDRSCMHVLDGVVALSLVADPAGGVDLVLDDGTAEHWDP